MKIYVQGGSVITITAPRDLESGELVAVGALVGYTQTAAAEGDQVAIVTDGVYAVSVASATNIEVGAIIYLDDQALTTVAEDTVRIGIAVTDGASDGATVQVNVKLNA